MPYARRSRVLIAPPSPRGPNLQAGIPYLIGFTIITAEVFYHG